MLTVIVPTYLEAENVHPLLARLEQVRGLSPEPLEVLIVDYRSADGTAEAARALLDANGLGRVITYDAERGLAAAVREGLRHAHGDLVAVMDADLSHPPELLPELVAAVRAGQQVAIASRYIRGGRASNWPWTRRRLSRIGNLMVRPLVPAADATSGYFVTERRLLDSIAQDLRGFKVLLDLLVRGDVRRVQEVPYEFADRIRGTSKLGSRPLWIYLIQVVSLYWVRLRQLMTSRRRIKNSELQHSAPQPPGEQAGTAGRAAAAGGVGTPAADVARRR